MSDVTTMRFHGPGWSLDTPDGFLYQLWAPQTEVIRDEERFPGMWSPDGLGWYQADREPRKDWAACWQSPDSEDGDFVKGASAEDVLVIFPIHPVDIQRQFLSAIKEAS